MAQDLSSFIPNFSSKFEDIWLDKQISQRNVYVFQDQEVTQFINRLESRDSVDKVSFNVLMYLLLVPIIQLISSLPTIEDMWKKNSTNRKNIKESRYEKQQN